MYSFFIFILLIPMALANHRDKCTVLFKMVTDLEKEIQLSNLYEEKDGKPQQGICSEKTTELIEEDESDLSTVEKAFLKEHGCSSLAAIEGQMAQLMNEQALLLGFKKLKDDIAINKTQVADPNVKKGRMAGLNFVNGLNTATALELALKGSFLQLLKQVKSEDRADAYTFAKSVRKICKEAGRDAGNSVENACGDHFKPNKEAIAAINELIDNSTVSEKELTDWRKAISIKRVETKIDKNGGDVKEESSYSFTEMSEILGPKIKDITAGKLNISREQLAAIKRLDDFEDGNGLELDNMKKDIKPFELMQTYKFHVEDLKNRQHLEWKSKVTLFWSSSKETLNMGADADAVCAEAKTNFDQAQLCFEYMGKHKDKLAGSQKKSIYKELDNVSKVVKNHLARIDLINKDCLEETTENIKTSGELPPACVEAMKNTDSRLVDISSKLKVLKAIKERVVKQNADNIKVRNMTLATLGSIKGCAEVFKNEVECSIEGAVIDKTIGGLTSDVSDLIFFNKEPANLKDLKELCDNKEIKIQKRDVLCAGKVQKKDPPPAVVSDDADEYEAPTTAPSDGRSPTRDAAIQGLGMMTGAILGPLLAPPSYNTFGPPFNPYSFGPGFNNGGFNQFSLSDSLLFGPFNRGAFFYGPVRSTPPTIPQSSFFNSNSNFGF